MAELNRGIRQRRTSSKDEVSDLTFDNYCCPKDSKYIVKAVGEILLDIQNFLSEKAQEGSTPASCKENLKSKTSSSDKRLNYKSKKIHSDEEIAQPINEINTRTEQTYHRRVLDKVVSHVKKPVACQNGSLDWKKIESTKFPVPNVSKFHCSELTSHRQPTSSELKGVGRIGNVYGVNRVKLTINAFVSSFYKHYPIVSYSSFILSLIYIDRFIKSQCEQELKQLSKFSLTRLFLVSIIIAMKYHEEYYIENRYFFKQASKYCSVSDIQELNDLEKTFLEAIDYRLYISEPDREKYFKLVDNRVKVLKCEQFKLFVPEMNIIEDYMTLKNSDQEDLESIKDEETAKAPTNKAAESKKIAPIMLNGKIFKTEEIMLSHFGVGETQEAQRPSSGRNSPQLGSSPRTILF